MSLPKITIVTPSFNQGSFIEQTILSVINQDYQNVELIIIDGGSSDDTLNVIKKYEKQIYYWISEPDNGQADAINKGLNIATGDIFNWINSDDYLTPGALQHVARHFQHNAKHNVLCGFTHCFYEHNKSTSHTYRMGTKKFVADTIFNVQMNQPGTFYRTKTIRELNGVNTSLRYVFDDELWFKYLCKYGLNQIGKTEKVLANFRLHSSSKTVSDGFSKFNEELQHIYMHLAKVAGAPEWLLWQLNKTDSCIGYVPDNHWDISHLETERYTALLAYKYINTLYLQGYITEAKEALSLIISNNLFQFNRILTSLYLKLLFK